MILGTAQLGAPYGVGNAVGKPDDDGARMVLDAARSAGVELLDTAEGYGDSETRIGRYLAEEPGSFRVCTKLPVTVGADGVRPALEASLKRLSSQSVDLCYLHRFEQFADCGIMTALRAVREDGLARRLGVSIYHPAELEAISASPQGVEVVQIPFNVLSAHRWTGAIAAAREAGLTLYARSVYLQGLVFLEPGSERVAAIGAERWLEGLRALVDAKGCGISRYCWGFAAAWPGIDEVVVGCETPGQVLENRDVERTLPAFSQDEVEAALEMFGCVPDAVVNPSLWPDWSES